MGKEIELKYLIRENNETYHTEHLINLLGSYRQLTEMFRHHGNKLNQGYLPIETGYEIAQDLDLLLEFSPDEARLRSETVGINNFLHHFTMKGKSGEGRIERHELEVEVSKEFFNGFWKDTQGQRVEKIRWKTGYQGLLAEFDYYTDRDLIVAEIEVPSLEMVKYILPLGKDITEDAKYKNKNLAK